MLLAALTTLIAIAAVVGTIGYRVYRAGESGSGTITDGTVFLPKGARVVSTTVSGNQIVVTLDNNGTTEVRIYDRKTFQQIGRLRFNTQP